GGYKIMEILDDIRLVSLDAVIILAQFPVKKTVADGAPTAVGQCEVVLYGVFAYITCNPSNTVTKCILSAGPGRRQLLAIGTTIAPWLFFCQQTPNSFAAETKKGFLLVTDRKDGYNFLYPFGWQEVIVQGQDKVFKDVIEPLESVSVNMIPTAKQDVREFGPPKEVAETLIKNVLASPSQKTKLIEASEKNEKGKGELTSFSFFTFSFLSRSWKCPTYFVLVTVNIFLMKWRAKLITRSSSPHKLQTTHVMLLAQSVLAMESSTR
ncbi:oxygen-evolving enhancer protein 2, partial [Striga asiatica]